MATLDPFEPIREGLKDVRDAYKTRRTLDLEEDKTKSEKEEKRLKREKERREDEAKTRLGERIRENVGGVFADPEGAALAIPAGVSPSVFRTPTDRSGTISYPAGVEETFQQGSEAIRGTLEQEDKPYSFDRGGKLQDLKGARDRMFRDTLQISKQLPTTKNDKGGVDAAIKYGTAQVLGLTKMISNYEKINENLDDALKVFKSDDGKIEFDKAMAKYNKDIIPLLEQAGVPTPDIKAGQEDAIVNFANDWRIDKDSVNSLFKTYMDRADDADKRFSDEETQKVLRYGKDLSVDALKKAIQDDRFDPFHRNLLSNILRTKFFQEEASKFLLKTTGAVKEFVPITDDQIDELYKAVNVPIATEALNPAESIREKARTRKTEDENEKEMKRQKGKPKNKTQKSYK